LIIQLASVDGQSSAGAVYVYGLNSGASLSQRLACTRFRFLHRGN
jgi:hypothetical protein